MLLAPAARANHVVRVGYYNLRPLVFQEEGNPKGFFIDILNAIAEKEHWELKYVPGSWAECLTRLKSGEIDLLPAIAYSEERAQFLDFTSQYLFLDWAVVYQKKGGAISSILDLEGKRISALKDSIYTLELETLLKQFDLRADFILENEYAAVLEDVAKGKADAGVCTNVTGTLLEDAFPIERTGVVYAAIKIRFAVKKGDNAYLVSALDGYFKTLKEDKLSLYYASYDKWLGLSPPKGLPSWLKWGLGGLAAALVTVAVFALALKKTVTRRTRQLTETNAHLADSEARFRATFDQAAVGIALASLDGRWMRANPKFLMITGYSREEIAGMTYEDITHPDDLGKERVLRARLLSANREAYYLEKRYMRKNGAVVWVDLTVSMVRRQSGEPGYFISIAEDVTERKYIQDELKKAQGHIKDIIDSMPSAVAGLDPHGRITHFSREAATLAGISPQEASGRPLDEIFPELTPHMDAILSAIAKRRALILDRRLWKTGDDVRYKDVMLFPLTSDSPLGHEGAVIRIDDVTERVRIQQMMIQTEKMLSVGGLAAGMAHEINNPLGIIMASCQNARRRLDPGMPKNLRAAEESGLDLATVAAFLERQGLPRFIDAIEDSAARAARIVRNMLNYSRKSESRRSPQDVNQLLDKAVALAASDYDLKKNYDFKVINIIREYAPDIPPVMVTETEIEQVFLNLLRNAAQALSGQDSAVTTPRIILRTSHDDAFARIDISDNGPGMDEETRKRAFEPFFTTKTVDVGTGLGLSVSYFIITNNHGGEIQAESSPGKGARFTIKLPLK